MKHCSVSSLTGLDIMSVRRSHHRAPDVLHTFGRLTPYRRASLDAAWLSRAVVYLNTIATWLLCLKAPCRLQITLCSASYRTYNVQRKLAACDVRCWTTQAVDQAIWICSCGGYSLRMSAVGIWNMVGRFALLCWSRHPSRFVQVVSRRCLPCAVVTRSATPFCRGSCPACRCLRDTCLPYSVVP